MVKVSAPTNQIVQIDATSTNAAEAQAMSQAIADSYVGYVSDTAREVTAAALGGPQSPKGSRYRSRSSSYRHEIAATIKRHRTVDPNSPEANEEAQLLAGLRTEQANLAFQLDKVLDKIATGTPLGSVRAQAPRSSNTRPKRRVPQPWCGCSCGHPWVLCS